MKHFLFFCIAIGFPFLAIAQEDRSELKIKHADPVFDDLTTQLGGEKGDNELNINLGYRNLDGLHHTLLNQLEMEFAPSNNLGIEILIPFTTYFARPTLTEPTPDNRLEFLQWTLQYTFYQSFPRKISLAFGLVNNFESQDPYRSPQENKDHFSVENIQFQPFMIAAKNWEDKYFLLFKGGPVLDHDLEENIIEFEHQLTTALHYKFSSEQEHYLGVEFNKSLEEGDFEMFIRPQIKLAITEDFNIGALIGIPVSVPDTKWSAFLRLAYEF